MKILVAVNQARVLYDFKRELVGALIARGDDVALSFEEDFRAEYFRELGATVSIAPIDPRGVNPIRDLKLARYYRRLLRETRPDLVLTLTIKPNVYCGLACRRLGVPRLATISGLGAAVNAGGALGRLAVALYRLGLKNAERVFCQNEAIAQRALKENIARREQIVRVPGSGVDLERFQPLPYPKENAERILLFIGRLMPDKGVLELLDAAREIRKSRPDVRIQILGASERGCATDALVDVAAKEGLVDYLGYQLDVRPFVARADAVVLPSWHEGLSNVLLEAAASARPVLASRVPGCAETFDEGGSGLGFEPRDANSLRDAIDRFFRLPRETRAEMGRRGREKMEREFSRADVVATYLREIDDVARNQR